MSPRSPKMSRSRPQESPRGASRAAKSGPEVVLKNGPAKSIVKYVFLQTQTTKFIGLAAFWSLFSQPNRVF